MLNSGVASYSSINVATAHVWPPTMRKCRVPNFSLACLEHSSFGGLQSFDRDEFTSKAAAIQHPTRAMLKGKQQIRKYVYNAQ